MKKGLNLEGLSLEALHNLIYHLREEFPEAEDKIKKHLDIPVCDLGDILMRTTTDKSYSIYQTSTLFHCHLHYPVLHNLWTGRTRTIMGNTKKDLITALGYVDRPQVWSYNILEQACRHHEGLIPGNLKRIGTLKDIKDFLTALCP